MVQLIERNTSVEVVCEFTEDLIRDTLTFSKRVKAYKGFQQQEVQLLKRRHFPAGFLPRVLGEVPLEVVRSFEPFPWQHPGDTLGELEFMKHQTACFDLAAKNHRGVFKVGTGGGKSFIAQGLLAGNTEANWLVLIHKENLLDDLVDTYTRAFGEVPGIVKSKCFAPRRVTFAMIPSLHKALDKGGYELLRDAQGVIQDECHRAGGDQALHLLSLCTNATRWYGLSATPYDRADGTGFLVEGAFGPELCEVTQDDLIDAGRTVPAEVRVVPYYHPPYGFNDRTQWKTIQDRAITRNEARNSVLEEIGLVAAKPAIAFVSRKEHGHELTARLRERGMEVSYVDGTAPVCMRQDDANMLAKGRLDLIISTTVFAEGVNIPKLASVIICGGTKATTTIIQELGRGTRVTDGKDSFEVWDIADIGCGALEGQSNTRVRMYRKTGYPVHTVALEHGTVRVVRSRGKL